MKKIERLKKKYNNFLYDHIYLKRVLHETNGVLCGLISALLYAFGFACFISSVVDAEPFNIVTGGVSGLTQNIALIIQFSLPNVTITAAQVQAIGYTCFNIPLLIFAFLKIGKRFAIQTAINVVLSSLFLWLLTEYGQGLIHSVVESPMLAFQNGGQYQSIVIVRALFAGICTGFSSAIAFKGDLSCGGIDIVTYYVSMRKSTSVGKYSIIFNSFIVLMYSVILVIHSSIVGTFQDNFGIAINSLLVSAVYMFITSLIVDLIHLRNKKIQIEFISKNQSLGEILIANFPHGATMSRAEGVYSNEQKYVIHMVVSSFETQKVVALARRADPHVFITVTSLVQVYGNFFIRPVN